MGLRESIGNLFHTIGGLVIGENGEVYASSSFAHKMLGQKGVQLIDTSKPRRVYKQIPQLKAIIDRKATMFSSMVLKVVDAEGNRVESNELLQFLQNPNPYQSQNEFLKEASIQLDVYGNQFTYKNISSSLQKVPTSLSNISPAYMSPILTGKVFNQTEMIGIISAYEFTDGSGSKQRFETECILYNRISDLDNPIIGESPICSLEFPLSNTKLAYEYRNAILGEMGALGFLSIEGGDGFGAPNLLEEDMEELEREFADRARKGKRKTKFTKKQMKWNAMTFPVKDLMLFEEVDANMITMCDAYGMNINIFSNKNATYENVKQSIIQTFDCTIIPAAEQYCQSLTRFLKLDGGIVIVPDFSHIAMLKTDEQRNAQTLNTKVTAIAQLVQLGVLSPEMALSVTNELTGLNIEPSATKSIVDNLNRLSPLVSNNVIQNLTVNEIRSIAGLPAIEGGDVLSNAAKPSITTSI
jgi:phage portal protein BeeE